MKAVVIADEESLAGRMPVCNVDLLISHGDLNNVTIERAGRRYNAKTAIAVRGYHESLAAFPQSVVSVPYSVMVTKGVSFGGVGGGWRYKKRGWYLYEQEDVSRGTSLSSKVDVIFAHNSPRGVHERDGDVH